MHQKTTHVDRKVVESVNEYNLTMCLFGNLKKLKVVLKNLSRACCTTTKSLTGFLLKNNTLSGCMYHYLGWPHLDILSFLKHRKNFQT